MSIPTEPNQYVLFDLRLIERHVRQRMSNHYEVIVEYPNGNSLPITNMANINNISKIIIYYEI